MRTGACRKRKMIESKSCVKTSIKLIIFSGKKNHWITWEEKLLAKSKHRGYREIMLRKLEVRKSTDILDMEIDEDKIKVLLGERRRSKVALT